MFDEKLLARKIYQTAFTHRSFLNESRETEESNERLEFLGDSILSFIVSAYVFEKRPDDNEGSLTALRSYIVKTGSLARSAVNLGLGNYLRMSKGEELSGGRENTQLLANTYEALLGAIYLDQGIESAAEFVRSTLLPLFENEVKSGPPKDAKSFLQEIAQNKTRQSPKYKILSTEGPDHARKFTIGVFLLGEKLGEGSGMSKQYAEEQAAAQAIEKLAKQED